MNDRKGWMNKWRIIMERMKVRNEGIRWMEWMNGNEERKKWMKGINE